MDRRLAAAHNSRALPERLHLKQWKVWALVLTLKQRAVAPHIYESEEEATAHLHEIERKNAG